MTAAVSWGRRAGRSLIPFGRPNKRVVHPALDLFFAALAAEMASARAEHPSPILSEPMRSYSGVSTGAFLPSLRGYCAHAVLGAMTLPPVKPGREGIVTLSDGRTWQVREAAPGELADARSGDGTGWIRVAEAAMMDAIDDAHIGRTSAPPAQ